MTQVERARATVLDEQLCFALYTASRAMTSCYRPMLDALGLTYPQFLVLLVLWERGDCSVTGIGNALQLETGTLSPLLKRLEATGFITRTRQMGDENEQRYRRCDQQHSVPLDRRGGGEAPVAERQQNPTQENGYEEHSKPRRKPRVSVDGVAREDLHLGVRGDEHQSTQRQRCSQCIAAGKASLPGRLCGDKPAQAD